MVTQTAWHPLIHTPGVGKALAPWYHFSIDDVFASLIEVSDAKIPLFAHPYFAMLKRLHGEYGLTVGLHLFHEGRIGGKLRSLRDIRDLRNEIENDGDWLFFGPHALNFETAPYNQTPADQIASFDKIYAEIDRFAGRAFYAQWVRLHYYSESYELADYFAGKGVAALFSTERPAGSHRMPGEIKDGLIHTGSATFERMNFIRTQFRVESFADDWLGKDDIKKLFAEALATYKYIIFYTHEYEFVRQDVCHKTEDSCRALKELGVTPLPHA
ncbi:MAG: hypothetical protein H7837_12375 [Magnetococcus sp. MYC-9]